MTAFAWQTLLVLALSYLAGCILGCFGRKFFGAGASDHLPLERPAVPIAPTAQTSPAVAPPAAAAPFRRAELDRPQAADNAERFRRALAGDAGSITPQPISDQRSRPVAGPQPTEREPVRTPQPIAVPRVSAPTPVVPVGGARASEDAAALAAAAAVAAAARMKAPSAAPQPPAAAADDLTMIRMIDAPLAGELHRAGVTRFEQLAAWTSADVKKFSQLLGFRGRIQQENWIEQAQILARGGMTYYADRRKRGEAASARPVRDEGDPKRSIVAAVEANRVAASNDAPAAAPARGIPGLIVAPKAASPVPAAAAGGASHSSTPDVSRRAAFGTQQAARPAGTVHDRDSLQRIGGITAEIEKMLNVQGVTRYSQLAGWGPAEIERYDRLLGGVGRVARENWVEQAQILMRGGDTAYSHEQDRRAASPAGDNATARPASAVAATEPKVADRQAELAALRSVRSEAFRADSDGDARREPPALRVTRAGEPDDLKRIRGVGVLIEKKLHAMGVTTYQEIANWSANDVARVSERLDFKGRIERENWIEQARILSSGGQTEFSRRVDRGALDY